MCCKSTGDVHFAIQILETLTLTLTRFFQVFSQETDEAGSKIQCLPLHTDTLQIHWWCPVCFINSWRSNTNHKWICTPMRFSHVFSQEIEIRWSQKVSTLLSIPKHCESIGDIQFVFWIHGALWMHILSRWLFLFMLIIRLD